MSIDKTELEQVAENAAMRTMELTFLHLGVDMTDPRQREELRERFEFLKRMSRGAKEVRRAAIKTCVGAVVAGSIAIFILGIKDYFGLKEYLK